MGLKPNEVKALTLSEFNMMYVGYKRRQENDWDIARRTWYYVMMYGGLGLKDGKGLDPKNLWSLPYTDRKEAVDGIDKITTIEQANDLLNNM